MDQEGYRIHDWGGDLRWESFPVPTPGPEDVLVRVEACGIGLTVLNCIAGDLADDPALLPRVPGHEFVGTVTQAGARADRELVGRRVVAYFYLACGSCPECRAGQDSRCRRLGGWVGTHRDGGYAPWAVLPAHNAIAIPEALDPVAATVVPDAVATPVHVCGTRARVTPADRVAVIGAGGGVGVHMVQVARLHGARVTGLDIDDAKLAAVERFGATGVRSDDFDSLTVDLWPEGRPTVVMDLVGSTASLNWGMRALGAGGRLVVLTTFRDRELPVDPRGLVFTEAAIVGSRYATRTEVGLAAELVATGRVEPVVSSVVDHTHVEDVHAALRSGDLLGRGALRWQHAAD